MKRCFSLGLPLVIGLGLIGSTTACTQTSTTASSAPVAPTPPQPLQYKVYSLPHSKIHTLVIPAGSTYEVTAAIAPDVQPLATFAQQHQAIAVLNGGFFDPVNGKSTSHVVLAGKQVANPQDNERLIQNPDLIPYLPLILNRSELRNYRCAGQIRYEISRHDKPIPPGCELLMALGAGPQLLPQNTSVQEGFMAYSGETITRDSLGSLYPNARSAIGLKADGSLVWLMVAERSDANQPGGLSLPELAQFMQSLGVVKGMNLDGGSSASFYYQGQTHFGKLNASGEPVQRPVKSVLLLNQTGASTR
uniref:Phosphodiester glycosidase domain-containing protein n=1 Tax=Cyanothece sp. (strain PCC 7425 / ATCC 29141) TaxID=395961 RepID=B8HPB3_CYAP4